MEVDKDDKPMYQEIAILEGKELHKIMKKWLVKYEYK